MFLLQKIRFSLTWAVLATAVGTASGQSFVELKQAMDSTDVEEKVGQKIDLSARFKGLDGNWYALKEFFYDDKPVFLSLNYANCPQLCQNQLKTIADKLLEAGLKPGTDFEFISISIDPREPLSKTRKASESFCRLLGGKSKLDGVHFLVGKKPEIDSVANSIGFVYSYVPSANHYSHAPLCVALTPEGKISRYIHGLAFTANDLKESSQLAGQGESTNESIASFVYRCLLFGVNPGQYTGNLMGLMRIAGAATVIVLSACVIPFWLRPKRTGETDETKGTNESNTASKSGVDVSTETSEL